LAVDHGELDAQCTPIAQAAGEIELRDASTALQRVAKSDHLAAAVAGKRVGLHTHEIDHTREAALFAEVEDGDARGVMHARGEPGELPDTSAPMQMILF